MGIIRLSPAAFLEELDGFLYLQVDVLLGEASQERLAEKHHQLVALASRNAEADKSNAAVWRGWEDALTGAGDSLFGFPTLSQACRDRQVDAIFEERASIIHGRQGARAAALLAFDYDGLFRSAFIRASRGVDRGQLDVLDAPLPTELRPGEFARALLMHDGRTAHANGLELRFRCRLPGDRALMVRLNTREQCLIAHPPLDTLFAASAFAHEIGHASEYELGRALEERFAAGAGGSSTFDAELESYRYEHLLLRDAEQLLELPSATARDVSWRLELRKSVQTFGHLLYSELAAMYFTGASPAELASRHAERVEAQGLEHAGGHWTDTTNLSRPTDRLAFVRAAERVFL